MRLDIQQLLASGNSTLPFEFELPFTDFAYLVDGVASVSGAIRNHGGYLELEAVTTINASASCGRCCELFNYKHIFNTTRPVAKSLTGEDNGNNGNTGNNGKNGNNGDNNDSNRSEADDFVLCDYVFCDDDGFVDLGAVFVEELLLELPVRVLCNEDCKGLCPKCGENLNKKSCGCSHKEIDPRLEVLKKLLNND